jgi:diguanylate cyclase (GGDEF)-like protein
VLRRQEGRVTASFGVAAYPEGGKGKEQLIRTVDRRLYEAKRRGRNRVCGAM